MFDFLVQACCCAVVVFLSAWITKQALTYIHLCDQTGPPPYHNRLKNPKAVCVGEAFDWRPQGD
jgi:hypothetical protein